VSDWSFLTGHARVLLSIAHDPGARLRDIAASLGITERSAHGILIDLTKAGYVVQRKDGRRNRYRIQAHLPLPEPTSREPAIGEILAVLLGNTDGLADADRSARSPADGADTSTARADDRDGSG
jgi:DNA-binding transcriptional ArsR family regulator